MKGAENNSELSMRAYQAGDDDAAYYICMKTGDHGANGEPFFLDDPDALGRLYVEPYLRFEPDLALVLEDRDGVCGYALGARDTKGFYQRYEREIRPGLAARFPDPVGRSSDWNRVQETYSLYHHPDYYLPDAYDQYPAHLHIDLLDRAQGSGWGRKMIENQLDRFRGLGLTGVHLGMSGVNQSAYGFYRHLGFAELSRTGEGGDESIYLGMKFIDLG
ncbi:MAG: GNAT family N-acetyltransferase [Verrucomicrobia bacterium]|jgi:ribosomal protein S18 acetylase RimI-like enzyme|nr:GNAT family N-acetyltransferase [Verrucomicrobiota bacterium]